MTAAAGPLPPQARRLLDALVPPGHARAQLLRFLRVTALASIPTLLAALTGSLAWSAAGMAVAGIAETAFRQVWPTVALRAVAPAPAAAPPVPPESAVAPTDAPDTAAKG